MKDKMNLSEIREKLIKDYLKLKKTKPNQSEIFREEFLQNTELTRSDVEKSFGSYGEFREIAEQNFHESLPMAQKALMSERSKKFDSSATKEDCINDLRRVQELEPLRFITRNYYRNHGKYSDSTWDKFFGSFSEFRKQAGLELNRHQQKLEREIAKHASHDIYRDFYRAEVLPYLNQYEIAISTSRYKVVLVGSDFHDIDCDDFMLSVFIDTAKRLQPDVITLNGDLFDCYDSSKYDKDVRELKIVERFEYVKKRVFKPLRELCPNTQIDFILGNHEWRIVLILANKNPNFRVLLSDVMGLTLADVFGVHEFKINLISKTDLAAFSKDDRNKEFKKNFKVYYDCFVVGHFKDLGYGMSGTSGHCHRPSTETFTNLVRGRCFWVETGCMCHTDAEYVQHRDKWGQSFLIAHIDSVSKTVNPEHIIVSGNNVVIHGIRYVRDETN